MGIIFLFIFSSFPFQQVPLSIPTHYNQIVLSPSYLILSRDDEITIFNLSGEMLTSSPLPSEKKKVALYPCSLSFYLLTGEGIYLCSLSRDYRLEAKLLEKRKIESSFPIGFREFAINTHDSVFVYSFFERGVSLLLSQPLKGIRSGCRIGNEIFLADSERIYSFRIPHPSSRLLPLTFSPPALIIAIFNLGGKLYSLSQRGKELYLARLERRDKRGKWTFLPLPTEDFFPGEIQVREASPFLYLRIKGDLYQVYPTGYWERLAKERIVDFAPAEITGDGFADIACLFPEKVCLFLSQGRELRLKREKAKDQFLFAIKKGDKTEAERAFLTFNLFSDLLAFDEKSLWRERKEFYITSSLLKVVSFLTLLLLLIFLPILFLSIYLKRKVPKGIAQREPAEIINLALEIITLDHNFVIKGNLPAAQKRLSLISQEYHLPPTEAPPPLWDDLWYKNFLHLLITSLPQKPLPHFLRERLREVKREWDRGFVSACQSMDEEVQEVLLCVDRTIEGAFTHIISDHFRHARSFAEIKVRYLTPTDWARKVRFSFLSDAESEPKLNEGHLAEDLRTLSFRYGNYITYGKGEEEGEKLWLTFLDIIRILKDIMER